VSKIRKLNQEETTYIVLKVLFYLASTLSLSLFFIHLFTEKVSAVAVLAYISGMIAAWASSEVRKSMARQLKSVADSMKELINKKKNDGTGSSS
jgi:hypothetical protein